MQIWTADIVSSNGDKSEYVIRNKPYDGDIHNGDSLNVDIVGRTPGSSTAPNCRVFIEGQDHGNPATSAPQTQAPTGGGGSQTQAPSGGSASPETVTPGASCGSKPFSYYFLQSKVRCTPYAKFDLSTKGVKRNSSF